MPSALPPVNDSNHTNYIASYAPDWDSFTDICDIPSIFIYQKYISLYKWVQNKCTSTDTHQDIVINISGLSSAVPSVEHYIFPNPVPSYVPCVIPYRPSIIVPINHPLP